MLRYQTALLGLAALTAHAIADDTATPLPTKLPPGFEANIFAAPPLVNYPTFVCPTPNGDLFVAIDKNGSIDRKEDRGMIALLKDTDGDGKADKRTDFAKVTSPRGIDFDGQWLYCLHPPTLTRYRDTNGDGVSDEQEDLITGIGFSLKDRPPDHTSNGATFGIDGWLYLAIGDFGFMEATGRDGRKLQLHGGGVVRVRPDGTEMELFARGTRNIYEVAVDPWLNVFTRDNTNDGGGWDIRLHALFSGAEMGYPSLFKNFTDETMPTLGIYGGGSGVGGVYVQEPGFPEGYGDTLYTVDWGRNAVFRDRIKGEKGAWFDIAEDVFCEIERPTCLKPDARGNLYLSSWKGATFTYNGENAGYVVRIRHTETAKRDADKLGPVEVTPATLPTLLGSPSHTRRMAAMHESVRKKIAPEKIAGADGKAGVPQQIAALFTGWQVDPAGWQPKAVQAAGSREMAPIREFILRALADRPALSKDVPTAVFTEALKDERDLVKAQAVIGLGRLGRKEAAADILAIAAQAPVKPDAKALAPKASTGVIRKTTAGRSAEISADIAGAKTLFLVVSDGGDGNGLDHADWAEPRFVTPSGEVKLTDLSWKQAKAGWSEVRKGLNAIGKPLAIDGQPVAYGLGTHSASVISYDVPAGATKFLARAGLDDSGCAQGDFGSVEFFVFADFLPDRYRAEGKATENEATDHRRALPHLASRSLIRLGAAEAAFAALDSSAVTPALREAALRVLRNLHDPAVVSGLIDRLGKTQDDAMQKGLVTALIRLNHREAPWDASSWGTRPDTAGPYYRRESWSESPRIEKTIVDFTNKAPTELQRYAASELERHRTMLKGLPFALANTDPQWVKDQEMLVAAMQRTVKMKDGDVGLLEPTVAIERTLEALNSGKADAKRGRQLFQDQGCISCHVVEKEAPPKGPNLYDIAKRYSPKELATSILLPSASVSQGFPTNVIQTKDGQSYVGFVIRESGEEVVLRNMAAMTQTVPVAQISHREVAEGVSTMTTGLVANLTPQEFASLIAFFQSIK